MLIVRAKAATVTTEFYAQWYRDERRVMSKLGSYPIISLADARKRFREEFAPAISSGAEPASVAARRRHRKDAGTVGELFGAYVASLRAAGKRSADLVEGFLETAESDRAGRPPRSPRAISFPTCRRSTIEGPKSTPRRSAPI